MNLENTRVDVIVAATVALCTVAVSLLFDYVLTVDVSFGLQILPLAVYFIYVFSHRRLPDTLDRPRNWILLAVAVSVGVLVIGTS